jgi:uncharacterized protein with HEPN domain
MPGRDWKLRIEDVLESIAKIQRYTAGITFETFASDEMRIDAVVRNITIIGEAARNIPTELQELYPQVPWDEMRGIRNVVVHECFGVSLPILWETVKQDLPLLMTLLKDILRQDSRS